MSNFRAKTVKARIGTKHKPKNFIPNTRYKTINSATEKPHQPKPVGGNEYETISHKQMINNLVRFNYADAV